MDTHYICRGECHSLSSVPEKCNNAECSRSGKMMEPCTCIDGMHNSLREETGDEEDN